MYNFKKILVGVDVKNQSGEALEYAIHLAQRNQAFLQVLYVFPSFSHPGVDAFLPKNITTKVHHEAFEQLEAMLQDKVPEEVDWEIIIKERKANNSYQKILDTAKEEHTDLIVLGDHDKHSLDHIWLGTNTEKVVRYAPCSVMVIKDKKN